MAGSDEHLDPYDEDDLLHGEAEAAKHQQLTDDEDVARDNVERHLRDRKRAYMAVFSGGETDPSDVAYVLDDLAWFCEAHNPQWRADQREQDRMVARREVYLRIAEICDLDIDAHMRRYLNTNPS